MSGNGHDRDCHLYRTGPVSDDEARQILSRFNSSHWKNATERARYSIPADPKRDDDIRLDAYIQQTRQLRADLRVAVEALERIEGMDTDWTQGPGGNVASLQNIAAAALSTLGTRKGTP